MGQLLDAVSSSEESLGSATDDVAQGIDTVNTSSARMFEEISRAVQMAASLGRSSRRHRPIGRGNYRNRLADAFVGAERLDRGGTGGPGRQGLCRGGRGGRGSCRAIPGGIGRHWQRGTEQHDEIETVLDALSAPRRRIRRGAGARQREPRRDSATRFDRRDQRLALRHGPSDAKDLGAGSEVAIEAGDTARRWIN